MAKHTITLTTEQLKNLRMMLAEANDVRCAALHHNFADRHGMAEDCPAERRIKDAFNSLAFLFDENVGKEKNNEPTR